MSIKPSSRFYLKKIPSIPVAFCTETKIKDLKLRSVRVGEYNLETAIDCSLDDETFCAPPFSDIKIEEINIPADYKLNSRNQHSNIALIRLARKVTFNKFVAPICLPLSQSLREKNYAGHSFVTAGCKKKTSKKS